MADPSLDPLAERLSELLAWVETLDEPDRDRVLELLDGIDVLHRSALEELGEELGADRVREARERPAVAWLFDAYGIGVDQVSASEDALAAIRPYIESHGGRVEVLAASAGVVQVRLSGACSGCTASAITLQQGVEEALRTGVPGFVTMEVEEEPAGVLSHPPPGPTLLQIGPLRPRGSAST